MRARVAKINRLMTTVKAKMAKAMLARLPQQLQRYAETGERPDDPLAGSYVTLTESALAAMDSSVGGDGHDEAVIGYERALSRWRQELKGAGL